LPWPRFWFRRGGATSAKLEPEWNIVEEERDMRERAAHAAISAVIGVIATKP
jgi:hypothetical protein